MFELWIHANYKIVGYLKWIFWRAKSKQTTYYQKAFIIFIEIS